ncbi:MAG: DUF3332 domain-containing protein [Prevotella sp.]|nr:DUF3332 domain-containing protein [Prevotella sp.]
MKKKFLLGSAAVMLSGSILFSSCIGSFNLTNKVLAWNKTIDNKFVNELVFLAMHIVPVYEITIFADVVVLNTIEFWTGDNPVQAGIVKQVQGENGIYTVETLENGYSIKNENGENAQLIYNQEDNTWSWASNGESGKLIKFTDDANAIVYLPDGSEQPVELSANGVLAMRQIVSAPCLAMK